MAKNTKNTVNNGAAVVAELSYVALNHGSRAKYQSENGVGLNAGATYVSRHIEENALKASIAAVKDGKLKWVAAEVVILVKGNKGTSARFGRVSECGGFVECVGTTGAKGVLSVGIFGEKGTLEILSVQEAAQRALAGQSVRFQRTLDKQEFVGRTLGGLDAKVCAMAYGTSAGALLFVDIETDVSNVYNSEVRGACGGDNADLHALSETVLTAIAAGTATRKGKGRKKAEAVVEEAAVKAVVRKKKNKKS